MSYEKETSRSIEKQLKFVGDCVYSNDEIIKEKETITLKPVKAYRAISVDTIRDRPCCCTPKKLSGEEMERQQECLSTVASEIVTPMMAKQGAAQGMSTDFIFPCII